MHFKSLTSTTGRNNGAQSRFDCKRWAKTLVMLAIIGKSVLAASNASVIVGAANSGNCAPFTCSINLWGGEYQQIYSSSAFSGPTNITSLTFYNTQYSAGAYTLDSGNFDVYLSTTSASVGGLNTNMATNIGSNETLVYSGSLPADSQNSLGGSFTFQLTQAFSYDPSAGNLLMTVTSSNGAQSESPALFLDADDQTLGPSDVTRTYLKTL
jgi:hypothetical protein